MPPSSHSVAYARSAQRNDKAIADPCIRVQELARSYHGTLVEIFIDNGVSGAKLRRPAMTVLRQLVNENRTAKIYCAQITDITRSVVEWNALRQELDWQHCEVIYKPNP